jgi:hypothetical protein
MHVNTRAARRYNVPLDLRLICINAISRAHATMGLPLLTVGG